MDFGGAWNEIIWLIWWALVNTVINLRVSWIVGNFLTTWRTISYSRRTLLHGIR